MYLRSHPLKRFLVILLDKTLIIPSRFVHQVHTMLDGSLNFFATRLEIPISFLQFHSFNLSFKSPSYVTFFYIVFKILQRNKLDSKNLKSKSQNYAMHTIRWNV